MAAASGSGCSNGDWDQAALPNQAQGQGYRWVGDGDEGNFGSAYSFCRNTLGDETQGQRLQGGAGAMTTLPGGPTTIPGYSPSTQSTRSSVSNQRQFTSCMESQGWALNTPGSSGSTTGSSGGGSGPAGPPAGGR